MLDTALELPGPSSIRFPKTPARHIGADEVGQGLTSRKIRDGDGSICLLGVGKLLEACELAASELEAEGRSATVWDVRVVSPADPAMLLDAAAHSLVVTAEDGVRFGGAGMFLVDALHQLADEQGLSVPDTRVLGVPRSFIAHGKADDILADLGLDGPGVASSVRRALGLRSGDRAGGPSAPPRT